MPLSDTSTNPSLSRPALAVAVTDRVRSMIMEGELKPGQKVPERALSERFQVSRTPLREAIKMLAHEGFLELVPNRGAVVARQSEAELREIFPLIAVLEGLAGEMAADNASDAEIAEIASLTERMRAAYEAGDRPTYFDLNQTIHAAILRAAGNEALVQHHGMMARRVYRARYQANLSAERWRRATVEHEAIAATLAARDGETLGRLMRTHLTHKLDALLHALHDADGATGQALQR